MKITGHDEDVKLASDALKKLYEAAGKGIEITKETLHLCIQEVKEDSSSQDYEDIIIKTPKKTIKPRSINQSKYIQSIKHVLIRPAVEAGEKLGFLPGDLSQKVDPYLRPLYDAMYQMIGFEKSERLMNREIIEIAPLAYMRGRTLNNSFIIMDESQNTTTEQMKMFLTRMGFGSYAVINGDLTQIDLPKNIYSGLKDAVDLLDGTDGIGFTRFNSKDVVFCEREKTNKKINVKIVCNTEMQELNKTFRNKDKNTNVLAFVNDDESKEQTQEFGDIAICYPIWGYCNMLSLS